MGLENYTIKMEVFIKVLGKTDKFKVSENFIINQVI